MDAKECFKEYDRMCRRYRDCLCQGCGINEKCNGDSCNDYIKSHPEEAAEIIEQWSLEHPKPNRQSEFLRIFPKAKIDANNVITICPYETCISYKCDLKWGENTESKCRECRKKYWLEEIENNIDI